MVLATGGQVPTSRKAKVDPASASNLYEVGGRTEYGNVPKTRELVGDIDEN